MNLNIQKKTPRLYPSERKILKQSINQLSAAYIFARDEETQKEILETIESMYNAYSDEFEVH